MRAASTLRIGRLAAAVGVSVDAVRYYERQGLLPRAARSTGGFRVYPREAVACLQFIKEAQRMGLHLAEIRQLVDGRGWRPGAPCGPTREVIAGRLAAVERQIGELRAFRRSLRAALAACDRVSPQSPDVECPVVRRLSGGSRPRRARATGARRS